MTVDVTTRPRTLESYVGGQWVRGTGKGQTLAQRRHRRPRRPDRLAPASTSPRRWPTAATPVGPKLRKLSFHERAADAEGPRPVT